MKRVLHLTFLTLLAAAAAACDEPEVDDFRSEGGSSPDPTGVIEGTVLYVGPRPTCEYSGDTPVRVVGRVILTLFEYDNPPPPTGSASSAENLLTIPGGQLFTDLSDCLPKDADPTETETKIMRSAAFVWPEIELEKDHSRTFQIRGFYDYDEDFNPFFSVSNLPTRGDVAGGAFVDADEVPPTFLPIEFPSQQDAPDGAVNSDATVTLGAVVQTEQPVFEVNAMTTTALSSEAFIPPVSDSIAREQMIYAMTNMKIRLITTGGGGSRSVPEPWQMALDAAGRSFDFTDPRFYAWYVKPVDADGDGMQDAHPILGTGGVQWETPIVIMRRIKNEAETAAGFPDVLLIASVRPTQTAIKRVFYPSIDIAVAPVAAVDLNPANPICRVPYLAPGNVTDTLERIPVECHEVPTGPYSVNVIHGLAGGTYREEPVTALSDTGWAIDGDSLSGQAWSVPNELGDPCQLAEDCNGPAVESQGNAGRFVVHDPDPGNAIGRPEGAEGCETALDPAMMMPREVEYMDVPPTCCGPITQFCGLPLCDTVTLAAGDGVDAEGRTIRAPGQDTNGDGELDCIPFHMPVSCCTAE